MQLRTAGCGSRSPRTIFHKEGTHPHRDHSAAVRSRVIRAVGDAARRPDRRIRAASAGLARRERLKTVIFVCTANICRSPMAQAIFNALAEDGDLPFQAESAGTSALKGKTIAPNAVAALEEAGIYPGPHRARQVGEAMIEGAELVLAMTPQHAATLRQIGGNPAGGIHALPEYAMGFTDQGIADPHGLTMSAYRSTLRQIYEHVERVVGRLDTSEHATTPLRRIYPRKARLPDTREARVAVRPRMGSGLRRPSTRTANRLRPLGDKGRTDVPKRRA